MTTQAEGGPSVEKLCDLVARLRAPDGCPWDREQTLADVRAYLLEEAHEVADAIDRENWDELLTELGDLLFHVVFVARLAEENDKFRLTDVIDRIHSKMIARHPHVFGEDRLPDGKSVVEAWEQRKVAEGTGQASLLAGLAPSLPALLTSYRMTQKAAGVGFDWPAPGAVREKIEEELDELRQALRGQEGPDRLDEEVGDVLFSMANLARHLNVDPEGALARANDKFRRRFESMEAAAAARGRNFAGLSPEELEALWEEAKKRGNRPAP